MLLIRVEKLRSPVSFDTETTGLSVWKGARPYCISFCDADGQQAFFKARKVDPFTRAVTWDETDLRKIRLILSNPRIIKVGHNLKFDVRMMEAVGVKTVGPLRETSFAMHGVNNIEPSFKLKVWCKEHLGIDDEDQKELHKATLSARRKGKKLGWKLGEEIEEDYWMASEELWKKYNLLDTMRTSMAWALLEPELEKLGIREVYDEEMKLWHVIYRMETRGPAVDMVQAKKELVSYRELATRQGVALSKSAPGINFDSPKQLSAYLYNPKERGGLGLTPPIYTDKGSPSCNVEALTLLKSDFTERLLEKRHSEKTIDFLENYISLAIPDPLNPGGYAIHCDYRQCGAATARVSSARPNLQNVANTFDTRAHRPLKLRHLFIPRPGYVWLLADYHQVEVVIFAFVAQEALMLNAISNKRDIHTESTNRVWGGRDNPLAIERAVHALGLDGAAITTPEAEAAVVQYTRLAPDNLPESVARAWVSAHGWDIVAAEKSIGIRHTRNICKMLTFLKIFGGGANAAAGLIGCSVTQARKVLSDYDDAFPKIKETIEATTREGRRNGFVSTLYGRRLTADPSFAYRSMNHKVQSSAADLMKRGLRRADDVIQKSGLDAYPLLTIHDEGIFEVNKKHLYPWFIRQIGQAMTETEGKLPFGIEVAFSVAPKNWLEKKPLKLSTNGHG